MKSKRLFQLFIVFVLLLGPFGSASASTGSVAQPDALVINRSLSYWDATFFGLVNSTIYEKWNFEFTASHTFIVTVTPIASDLVPLLILMGGSGNELARGTGTLTSTQPAGSYAIQVQPESGSGVYMLMLREIVQSPSSSVSTVVSPASINAGESAVVTVNLNNVPAEGYTSAEFTCTYNPSVVQVSNILPTNLFGADPAVAINDPQNGSFIVAIAGSNGNKATTSGAAFTFSAKGLQAGQSAIECTVRVSKGDNILTSLPSTGTSLSVVGSAPTSTPTPTAANTATPTSTPTPAGSETPTSTPTPGGSPTPTSSAPVETGTPTSTSTPAGSATPTSTGPAGSPTPTSTSTPAGSPTSTSTPDGSATPTSTPVGTGTPTPTGPAGSPTPTSTSTPDGSATPTSTPANPGMLIGQVLAGKPVTVGLYDATNTLVTSVAANPNGTFTLNAPAGTYTARATASGFLRAEGSVTLTAGNTSTMPTVTLLAGDINGDNAIDQLDALTIGMNYNAASPAAADLNNDGVINVLDLELLAQNYRETGPIVWQ